MSELESTNIAELTTQIKDLIDARKVLITQLKSLNKRRLDMRDEISDVTSKLATDQAKLEPLYNEANKHKQLPSSTNIVCFWCTEPFNCKPTSLPFKYENDIFYECFFKII